MVNSAAVVPAAVVPASLVPAGNSDSDMDMASVLEGLLLYEMSAAEDEVEPALPPLIPVPPVPTPEPEPYRLLYSVPLIA